MGFIAWVSYLISHRQWPRLFGYLVVLFALLAPVFVLNAIYGSNGSCIGLLFGLGIVFLLTRVGILSDK